MNKPLPILIVPNYCKDRQSILKISLKDRFTESLEDKTVFPSIGSFPKFPQQDWARIKLGTPSRSPAWIIEHTPLSLPEYISTELCRKQSSTD